MNGKLLSGSITIFLVVVSCSIVCTSGGTAQAGQNCCGSYWMYESICIEPPAGGLESAGGVKSIGKTPPVEDPPPRPPKVDSGQSTAGRNVTTSLVLTVPADARVYLNGQPTRTMGSVREYATTQLAPGRTMVAYPVRVVVVRNGHTVVKHGRITLQAGRRHAMRVNVTPADIVWAGARSSR